MSTTWARTRNAPWRLIFLLSNAIGVLLFFYKTLECLSLERCRLANPEDRAASLGPGPRYWVSGRRSST